MIPNLAGIQRAADDAQRILCDESVTLLRYPSVVVADDPYQEPAVEPDPTEITLQAGVSTRKSQAKITVAGQEIEADYTLQMTVKSIKAAGVDPESQGSLDLLYNDRLIIRGVPCTIVKADLTGYSGSGHIWLMIYAVRETP